MASGGIISIPSDIITEILYRLPSKSVGRFRCVSKDWLSLLTSPQFIKIHETTLNQSHIIYQVNSSIIPYLIPFHQFEEEEALPVEFHLKLPYFTPVVYGSCNGLVLMSYHHDDFVPDMLVISNPTTREYVELPKCDYGSGIMFGWYRIGFFYDAESNDYKVATICRVHRSSNIHTICIYVDVYSLGTNTWTRVTDYPYKHRWTSKPGGLVNGFLHWIIKGFNDLPILVAFCLANEKSSEVSLPNDLDILFKYHVSELVNFDGKLAIFVEGEIWLMKEYGVKESWTKITLHGLDETPISINELRIFNYNEKILLVGDNQMLMYDIEEGKLCKHMYASRNIGDLKVRAMCVESLVSLKSSGTS
ncbi:F-box/kelch-repeat protein At3g06240-like [Rutidosis leptorrhynchoides]|uniref:F-box/kelch-repeat protein At3g06240-like n=1 Tax=Rutidosis leptorrhynchoides TaxID=125765 RepID=UPI003A99E323